LARIANLSLRIASQELQLLAVYPWDAASAGSPQFETSLLSHLRATQMS